MAKIVFTPSGFESPSFDATLGRAFLFEQIERHVPQHHKVVLAVILAHATGVLLKGDVEHPMETIFDPQWLRTAPPKAWALAWSIYKGGLNKLPEAMQASILQANIEVKRYNSLVDFDKFDKLRANRFVLNEQAEKVKTVKVTVSETCSGVAYNEQELTDQVTRLLTTQATTKLGLGYSMLENPQITITSATISKQVILSFSSVSTWVYALTTQEQQHIKTIMAGKYQQNALQLLYSLPGIESVSLQFSGFGDATKLPKDISRIHLLILYTAA